MADENQTEATPSTKAITIQGVEFEVSQPYAEGHTCTEAEAKALNQTRAENIRNNMAKTVKEANAEAGKDDEGNQKPLAKAKLNELAKSVAEYDAEYEFTLASVGGGRASRDPIEIEANRIARASITASLKADGRTLKSVTHDADGNEIDGAKERLAEAIAKVAAKPQVIEAARKAVKEREQLASADLSGLDI
ncbi:MAG: hypothetical protein CL484_03160 [Acidobacteria bacterium]|nr:hypothetical protein [Acidobacteriota bacterium]